MDIQVGLDMYIAVVGVLLPAITAVFKDVKWSKQVRTLVSLAVAIIVAAGHLFYAGDFNIANLPESFLKILFISTTTYAYYWKPTGIEEKISKTVGVGRIKESTKK